MAGCCDGRGCEDFFGGRFARRVASRYRKRGLDRTAARMVAFLEEPADVVVLHRVVCCYPDYERLLGAASAHARRLLVFSHPRRNAFSRALIATENADMRVRGKEFRAFAHPPAAMVDVCRAAGLSLAYAHRGTVWQVEGLSR